MNRYMPLLVAALLLLGLASDVFGGAFTATLNSLLTLAVCAGVLAGALLLWALAIGVLGHRGPRSTR